MSVKPKRRPGRKPKPKRRAKAKPKIVEEYELRDTVVHSPMHYDRDIVTYVGERKNVPSAEAQLRKIREAFPDIDIDESEIKAEKTTMSDVMEYFDDLAKEVLVYAEHPDILVRSATVPPIEKFVYKIQVRDILFAFPDSYSLETLSLNFWKDPHTDVNRFKKAVFSRMEEHLGEEPDAALDYDEEKLINSLFDKLKIAKKKGKKLKPEYKFWIFHSFAGYAAERILKIRSKKASETDESFGTRPEDVRLMKGVESLGDCDLKKLPYELEELGVTDKKGKRYKEDFLDEINFSETFFVYGMVGHDLKEVMRNIDAAAPELKRDSVAPKKSSVKKAMKKLGLSRLPKAQHEALKKLMKNESVILETGNGGGKRMFPVLWHMITGKPAVIVAPNLASIYTYREFLRRFFASDEIAVYNETFAGEENSRQALKNLKKGKVGFLLTTAERLLEKKALAAVKKNEEGLVVFSECQSYFYSGNACVTERDMDALAKIAESLEEHPCLFYSSRVDSNTGDDILKARKCETVVDSEGRSDLRLFAYKMDNMGEKLSITAKLLFELRDKGLKKGILFFNSSTDVAKMKRILQKLDYPFASYTGRDKEESLWRGTNRKQLRKFAQSSNMALLAYSCFGEGLDFDDADFVVCPDMPGGSEEFYHLADKVGTDGGNKPVFLVFDPRSIRSRRKLIDNGPGSFKKFQRWELQEFLDFLKEECDINTRWNPEGEKRRHQGFSPIDMDKLLKNIDPRSE